MAHRVRSLSRGATLVNSGISLVTLPPFLECPLGLYPSSTLKEGLRVVSLDGEGNGE